MNKSELAKILGKKVNLPHKKAEALITNFGEAIADSLAQGQKIIYSNFGTFYTVLYPSRVLNHPTKGSKKKIVMLPTNAIKWMPSGNIKDLISLGQEVEETTSFGAAKAIRELKKQAGLDGRKSKDMTEDDEIEIPIKFAGKTEIETPAEEEVEIKINQTETEKQDEPNLWEEIFGKNNTSSEKTLITKDPEQTTIEIQEEEKHETRGSFEDDTTQAKLTSGEPAEITPASRIINSLLKSALREKASDIHIEPTAEEILIRFRIDGALTKKITLPLILEAPLNWQLKSLAGLKEAHLPQDGRFTFEIDGKPIDFRITTIPLVHGEKLTLHINTKQTENVSLDSLDLREPDLDKIERSFGKRRGLVLLTGPSGAGKTTTLYSLVQKLDEEGINIITLEDPIEYQLSGISQSEIDKESGYGFAKALDSVLRHDPDVIMLSAIPDFETAKTAASAATNGHLILGSVNTIASGDVVSRLYELGLDAFAISSALSLIINQRLVHKLCPACRKEIKPSETDLKRVKKEIAAMPAGARKNIGTLKFYEARGCDECGQSGFVGRLGLYEILDVSPKIKKAIANRATPDEIETIARGEGMTTLVQDGIIKALSGVTTLEEVWRTI